MTIGKQLLLGAYVYGTLPYRRAANRSAARRGHAPVMVLFYHRVADDHPNPWTVSNAMFAKQIAWMQERFDLVSLEEAQRRIQGGCNGRAAVSITFDDGYADNCQQALPLLIQKSIPCTYFVSTRYVLAGEPFPQDVSRGCPLRPNSVRQLKALAQAGVEIGGHTHAHVDLGPVRDRQQLHEEVVVAAKRLEAMVDRPVRYFAFPYGLRANLNPAVFHLARSCGFQAVCSAYGGYNFPGDDAFHLQRIPADQHFVRLKNWLTIDPRKRAIKRFPYEQEPPIPDPNRKRTCRTACAGR